MKTIYFAADHAGYALKDHLRDYSKAQGHTVIDLGTSSPESVDYPDIAQKMADALKNNPVAWGILVCGSGIGISMAANRHAHLRAALVDEVVSAELSRQHNDANVLCLGSRLIGITQAEKCVDAFLKTPFDGGERHQRRVDKLSHIKI